MQYHGCITPYHLRLSGILYVRTYSMSYTYACMYVHVHMYVQCVVYIPYVHIYCMYVCTYVCMHVRMYVCTQMKMYIHAVQICQPYWVLYCRQLRHSRTLRGREARWLELQQLICHSSISWYVCVCTSCVCMCVL